MKTFFSHNSREGKTIYRYFTGLKRKTQRICSGSFVYQVAVATLLLAVVFSATEPAASKRPLPVQFGTDATLHILPAEFSATGWGGVKNVFVQDVAEDAMYQEFSAKNSAYITKVETTAAPEARPNASSENKNQPDASAPPVLQTNTTDNQAATTSNASNSTDVAPEQTSNEEEVPAEETIGESTPSNDEPSSPDTVSPEGTDSTDQLSEPEPESEPESAPEPEATPEEAPTPAPATDEPTATLSFPQYLVTTQVTAKYPLANESTTSPITTPEVTEAATEEPVEEQNSAESVESSAEVATDEENVTAETTATETAVEPETASSGESTVTNDATSTGTDETAQSVSSPISVSDTATTAQDNNATTAPANPVAPSEQEVIESANTSGAPDTAAATLDLKNFDSPALEPGEFLTGVQLRVSFGAQVSDTFTSSSSIPEIEVLFGTATSLAPVGVILIDDEVSNAINGGYQLFALPEITDISELRDAVVRFRYAGDAELLESAFLEAAWLEVKTKQVTEEDIAARGKAENLKHLPQPKVTSLVSADTNFNRDEAPLFHLRYNSQRNPLVRGMRNFFGADAVAVAETNVRHNSFGLLGITPEVSVTPEGLLTIEIPEDQLEKMRPGEYEIELILEEGNQTFTETFNFQWGILTINPHKSEYEVGETMEFSMGVLTPNGHTVCQANLDLYIINPLDQVERVLVEESGLCDGNNVIDVPDYLAESVATEPGEHTLYLERLNDAGEVIGFVYDSFLVSPDQQLSIERNGPTRIYPPAPYPMTLTVDARDTFIGTLEERVPRDFVVSSTTAEITYDGDWQTLRWDMSIRAGETESVSYQFDAPDLTPYLYELGPASLQGEPTTRTVEVASTTASTTELQTVTEGGALFTEHRQWKIASDAVGKMLLLWADGATVPAGWECISCTSGDPFFDRMIMGSSTYNVTGGTVDHTHSVSTSLLGSPDATVESGSGGPAIVTHTHTLTPTIQTISNLPEYRELRVIQPTVATGEITIPQGAIAIFDVASSSLPAGWNRYAAQDGRYVYGANTIGGTGGSNEHTHTVTGTTGAAAGGDARSRGGGAQASAATVDHTHTISTATDNINKEPPYIEVVLAQATADVSPVNGMIAMWTEDVDAGWIDVSSNPGDPFSNRFFKAAATYGATGGGVSHEHADILGVQTSLPSATTNGRSGASGASDTHTHGVNLTGFSDENHLPPYATVVFGKRQGTDPVYEQLSSRWYVNINNQTPSDPWPDDAVQVLDLAEREPITATSSPVATGDVVRLRLSAAVSNATSTAGSSFKLQYAAASVCSTATGWADVGDSASSTVWRGAVNGGVTDESTLTSTLLASTTVAQSYEETGVASSSPNPLAVDDVGEWDFVLEHNGATPGATYCFRLVEGDGTEFLSYTHYPQLYTNEAPAVNTLDTLFDNEKVASTSPVFTFAADDAEGETVNYEIVVDTTPTFASPVIERDTISDSSQFENQVLISDKAPFRQGELIAFTPVTTLTNGTTYYWRVRAADPEGSDEWGDWSSVRSFTIDTALTASAWHQTETEQFDTNILDGVDTASNQVDLATGSTTGTMVSTPINFSDGTIGTAWDSLTFTETDPNNVLEFQIEYQDEAGDWALIPDTDLSGNSAGFGTSPVSLLNLDVETYNTIRLVADFTADTGTPRFTDWTVNWGFRVETPQITKLFPNEQTGTTTPTFEFTTTDPQSDSLTYQIEWSQTPDFAAPTTRTSDTDGGFVNSSAGADLDPFNSGDTVQFTVQPADALTGSTTYWWRVRAKDTTGDNAYSFWTDARSFTVIPGTEVSTWFQTTADQFDTNILSGTRSLTSGDVTVATTASEAMLVYGEGTNNTPRYREWNGSALRAEGEMLSIGAPLKWAVAEAGTTREEYVAATVGTDNDINVQVFSTGVWDNLLELTTNMGSVNARGFDVTYETVSGDAMVAYCDNGPDPSYAIWDGSTWTTGGTINLTTTSDCEWIELTSHPTTDEIIINTRDAGGNAYEVQVWDGTAWGNASTFGQPRNIAYGGIDVVYEASGGQAIAVAPSPGGGPNRMVYNVWNGTTWSGETTLTIGGRLHWADLAASPDSDNIVLCYQNDANEVRAIRWTGAAWTGDTAFTTTVNDPASRALSCVFEASAGRTDYIIGAYSDTAATNYRTWNTTAWSAETQVNAITDAATMQLTRTGDALVLGAFFDDVNDQLLFSTWDGSAWSTTELFEDNASVDTSPFGRPYYLAPRNAGSEGTTIVSPGIDFDDGLGPFWQRFSWNDTQPVDTQIVYQLQYQTATGSWTFIPEIDLPGNAAGTTTGPFDLSGLNTNTYNVIRPYAVLSCSGAGVCPTIQDWKVEWAGGLTVSGTIAAYDEATPVNSGEVAVAVNGVLQTGKTGSISGGAWSISNVTVFPGDIVTVFVNGAADSSEAVAVTRYDGQGNINGLQLFERHLTLGSADATSTPLTNDDIGLYTVGVTEDVFFEVSSSTLNMCADTGCADAALYVASTTVYEPSGSIVTHDFENNGTFTLGNNILEVNGSWDNNATTTMTDSTVVFAATSSNETVDSVDQQTIFNNVTFGTTTGSGVWTLANTLDIDGDLTVARGTLARGATAITVAGDLQTGINGVWTGTGTTTFDGSAAAVWSDLSASPQNIGAAVIDGAAKVVSLASDVAAESLTIGANDTLDVTVGNYQLDIYSNWINQNNFLARNGTVRFVATSSGQTITTGADAFYDLTFAGVGGGWSFAEAALEVDNDFTVATGTVTLPTATTTIVGSFDATGGTFLNNNGSLLFTANTPETITLAGSGFTNVAHNLYFDGGGSWSMADTHATATNDVVVSQGTVTFPTGVLAIGGALTDNGGAFVGGTGTTRFYSSATELLTSGGSSFGSVVFDGTGSWSFADAVVAVDGDIDILQGSVTVPDDRLEVGGSFANAATLTAATGTLYFNSAALGETVDFGGADVFNITFDNPAGGWTLLNSATTTNDFRLASGTSFTMAGGETLSVGGDFENLIGGGATTWTGTTLSLENGTYTVNDKSSVGDVYDTVRIGAAADVSWWNSSAAVYDVVTGGSLYSQDNNAVDGELYIWGDYSANNSAEYWSYDTDFDGADLATSSSERAVSVRLADAATVTLTDSLFDVTGIASASTTISNQGSGTYTVTVNGGTTTAQFYEFTDLGATGLSLLGGVSVPVLRDGSYVVGVDGGTALTLASTTIDAEPTKQIFNVTFATTTAIAATNVTQVDGTPASYWWFRNGQGNLYSEAFDSDTGDPGSVRFDDSSLVLTVSGTVFSDDGVTPLAGGTTCDGATQVVHVYVEGNPTPYTGSCDNATGNYSVSGVTVIGDPTLTIYLNDAPDGEQGSVITRTPTADITDADIYANRVIVRNEDTEPLSIANLAVRDSSDDSDLQFTAATTSNPATLAVASGNELYVWASSTFTPNGEVTLHGEAAANGYDGTLFIDDAATFTAFGSSTLTIGGRLELGASSTLIAASSTVLMTASTSGKSITAPDTITFHELVFNGMGGTWNLGADIVVAADMAIDAGTLTGTGDITLPTGNLTGSGVLSLGGGTTTLAATNSLGGPSAWTFYNLQLGDTVLVGTTTPLFTSTTTVAGMLTIEAAHYLDAGNTEWDLSGVGAVFVENGTFIEDTSTIRYSGGGAQVLATQYHNLDLNAGAGSQTYTATGIGAIVDGDLTIGGAATTNFDLTANDTSYDVNGDVVIRNNGTLTASDSADFTIAGSYDNNGTFAGNGGTVTFDGAGNTTIAAGASDFSSVRIAMTGDATVTEHATATTDWTLAAVNSFTLTSGESLAVGGNFFNGLSGAATTWSNTTLRLFGGDNYTVNAATTSDSYGTLAVEAGTQIRLWGSDAAMYAVQPSASLYSQDHAGIDGDVYIWGDYVQNNATDYWSYATDFDGTPLGGSGRKVDVYLATSSTVTITGGFLDVTGLSTASTTIQSQTSETYSLTIGGNASTSLQYYEVRDINSAGLTLTGAPTVDTLSNGDIAVSQNSGTAMTVGGSVISANPAKNFTTNRFALAGVGSGFNVTATGTSVSSWRFTNHYGDIDGESFDVDPDGDPGYVSWDDSAALISISGTVYEADTTTVSSVCNSEEIRLVVAGISSATTTCNASTGAYSFSNVSFGPTDSVIVYINDAPAVGAAVTDSPVSNISGLDIYENHVNLRHENTDPITIADLAVYDSSDDADIPFTAVTGGTDTLTLPADRKLVIWENKTFAPGGDVTIASGGTEAYGGSLELRTDAVWSGAGSESLTIGGSFAADTDAVFTASNGTTTFTTTGAGRTIDVNESSFSNVAFTGSGSWSVTDPTLSVAGDLTQSAGTLTLPSGTSTVSGSFAATGGTFDANSGLLVLNGSGTHSLTTSGSDLATVLFASGAYSFADSAATTTGSLTIDAATVTFPSGTLTVGGDVTNQNGTIAHNTGELIITAVTTATITASSSVSRSDLYGVTFTGGGAYTFAEEEVTLLDSLTITAGDVTLASTTTAVGGSFSATGGTFSAGSSTVLFNSADTGETINPGSSSFYNVQIGAPTGGYTIVANATTTKNFILLNAADFTQQSGTTLSVGGMFMNSVGGTNTTWSGSTLSLAGSLAYNINTKLDSGDSYDTLVVGPDADVRMWYSAATTTVLDTSASLYSQDNGNVDGALNIYGDFHIDTRTEHWSYETDFDGTSLSGFERPVTVSHAANATTTVDGGTLNIVGVSGNETTITNQGSGTYAFAVSDGTLLAQYYALRNLGIGGLELSGEPTISSLSFGDYELAVDGGTLISLASSTLNANASLVITGNRFATTSAISGTNVTLTGETSNAWTFTGHTGNLDGEAYDVDGLDACGSVRWNDSECLITQQTTYRWRADDGGLAAPDAEWFNGDWDARQRVRVENADATTYTDAVVRLLVPYDADMQTDYDDLRFTDSTGTTTINHWLGSTTANVMAEVWVEVPSLPAEDTATLFMYYNNPTATSSASLANTFIAGDDFEDGNVSEYSGETVDFTVDGSFAYDGGSGLDAIDPKTGRTESGGIYRLDETVSQGETLRLKQYLDVSESDETCFLFGVQSAGAPSDNYGVCVDLNGTDRLVLVQDAVDSADTAPAVTLDSSNITVVDGWYSIEIDWSDVSGGTIAVDMTNEAGSSIATLSAVDSTYTSGGYGFTYWFQHGGWDGFHSRPTLTTEPTYLFGVEQGDGGANWASEENTAAIYDPNETARLRVAVENSGLAITNQQFRLEYAALGAAPSCEAVSTGNYQAVPVQASCTGSPVCMQNSTSVTNGAATVDLLTGVSGGYVAGEAREDPSNITSGIDIDQNEYTELEYVVTPTDDIVDENLCFRVTDSGAELDTYLNVAELSLRFDPVLDAITLNNAENIALLPATTTPVLATTTVTDLNGYIDIVSATSTFFRGGVAGGAACTPDNNNCYVASGDQCQFVNCAGNSCEIECTADIFFHADPTDSGSAFDGQEWFAFIEVEDSNAGFDFGTSIGQELLTLRAIDVEGVIDYGALEVNTDTGGTNASTSISNIGNTEADIEVLGTDLSDGFSSVIPSTQQKFATSTFTYSACGASCALLSSTTPINLDVDLTKPTTVAPPVSDEVFWGIEIPIGVNSAPHTGVNVFTPISP